MIDQKPKFPDNSKVRLRDGVDPSFYHDKGLPGNVGWIRYHKKDKYGFNQVFIEWDKDHWAYNGTRDGWTWEDHFEIVEDNMDKNKKKIIEEFQEKLAEQSAQLNELLEQERDAAEDESDDEQDIEFISDQESDLHESPIFMDVLDEDGEPATHLPYEATLDLAYEAAKEADSFVLIAMTKEDLGDSGEYDELAVPMVFHNAKDMKSSILAYVYLSQLAADFTLRMGSGFLDKSNELKGLDEQG